MPRILGVDLPNDKATHISLRYIYGIGPTTSLQLCAKAKVDPLRKAKDLSEEDVARLATILDRELPSKDRSNARCSRISPACVTLAATVAPAIAAVCQFAASGLEPTLAPAKAPAKQSPARRA